MARSEDSKDGKRGPSRPKAASTPKKDTAARTGKSTPPPAAPRKRAAAPSASKGEKPAAPSARRTTPPAKAAGPKAAKPAAAKDAKPARPTKAAAPAKTAPVKSGARATKPASSSRPEGKPAAKKTAAARTAKGAKRGSAGAPGLDEEQRIEDAKYQPRDQPSRLFEEERFIFPESYGQSRIRLLVKDPEWLFAHWDVDPQSLADLRAELGERASALSKLTLRVVDPQHGGESRVLLPDGARSWYVRADTTERSYRAQLGLTLPSGEFRSLAESNTVRTPRTGPAPGAAPRRARYDGVTPEPAGAPTPVEPPPVARAAKDPGPWKPDPRSTSYPGPGGPADRGQPTKSGSRREPQGGASDAYRR